MLFQENFSRYEFKYPMTADTMTAMMQDLAPYTAPDGNGDEQGFYTISSIYFDNGFLECYYETINNDAYRQKVRLRGYNTVREEDPVFFEIKAKINGLVQKRRVRMSLPHAMAFAEACVEQNEEAVPDEYPCSNPQILRELKHVIVSNGLKPVNVVSYERLALFALEDPELRITFDYRIRTRADHLDLTAGNGGNLAAPEDVVVLEVKSGNNLPFWLVRILAKYHCRNQTFSKYCSHYKQMRLDRIV